MTAEEQGNPIKNTARFAGLLYLIVAVTGAFALLYVKGRLIVPGDATATVANIAASERLFRIGIVSWLICQTVFVFLVLVLYRLLKPVDKNHALLMLILALIGVPVGFGNELNQFAVLLLLSGTHYLTAMEPGQLHAQAMLFLDLHEHGTYVAQIFWGLWLFPFGYLVFRSGFLPKVLGILLIVGGVGYLVDVVSFIAFPNFESEISQFTGIGEFLILLWLLFKGVNVEQWEKCVLSAARD